MVVKMVVKAALRLTPDAHRPTPVHPVLAIRYILRELILIR
jgi:hypothetical protein